MYNIVPLFFHIAVILRRILLMYVTMQWNWRICRLKRKSYIAVFKQINSLEFKELTFVSQLL